MSRASLNKKQTTIKNFWPALAAIVIVVAAGFLFVPGLTFASWVDPFEAPPQGNFTIMPVTSDGANQTKPANLSVGGNLSIGAGSGTSQACINNVCYSDLLTALADNATVDYLPLSTTLPATPSTGPVTIFGNNTIYHWNCVGSPCTGVEPGSGTLLNVIDFTIHRSQPPLEMLVNFIENYVCSNNVNQSCKANADCGGANTCGFRFVCQNNPNTVCTSSAQCGGQPCVIQGKLGNTFTLVFTMTDGSTRTVEYPGTTNTASGGDAQSLIVNTTAAKVNLANNQSLHLLTLDNSGPAKTITIATVRVSWTPPAGSPSVPLRSIIIGSVPPPYNSPGVVPTFVARHQGFLGTVASVWAEASTATPPFESYGVWAYHRETGGAALLAHNLANNSAGEFRGLVTVAGASGDLTLISTDKLGNTLGNTQAKIQLTSGDMRLTSTAGLNDMCLYGNSVCSNNPLQACTQNNQCGNGTCIGICINEWADIATIYGTAGNSKWTQLANDEYKTYLKRTTANIKLNVGGREQDKNSEFIYNQSASKLVVGIPTSTSTALHSLTCGDGACNGIETCGATDAAPQCTTDCSACTDTTPPADIVLLTVAADDRIVAFTWTEPTTVDFAGTLILRRIGNVGNYPSTNPTNGVVYTVGQTIGDATVVGKVVCGAPGGSCNFDNTGLTNGTTYNYEFYAYDASNNYAPDNSANTRAWGTPDSGGGASGCFLKGTPILMADGSYKDIDQLTVGEKVMAYNEQTQQLSPNTIIKTFVRQQEGYILINGRLKVSPPHKFYAEGHWVDASELRIGDSVRMVNGQTDIIRSLKSFQGVNDVYNIEVTPNHTYVVDGYVVHNKTQINFGS